jgi:hypothetical protein
VASCFFRAILIVFDHERHGGLLGTFRADQRGDGATRIDRSRCACNGVSMIPSHHLVICAAWAAVAWLAPSQGRADDGWQDAEESGAAQSAAEPGSPVSLSASANAFHGTLPAGSDFAYNPFGPGLGLHVGVTLPLSVYVGASYEHFFGGEPLEWVSADSFRRDGSLDQLTAWVGYELALDGIVLRPRLGLGYVRVESEITTREQFSAVGTTETSSSSVLVVAPALGLSFPIEGALSLLVEGRYQLVPEELAGADALVIGVGFGVDL